VSGGAQEGPVETRDRLSAKEVADGYLRLYERQMSHFEKTQEVEWKGNFGVWTLLAAAIAWASQRPEETWPVVPTLVVLVLVVAGHALWLYLIHGSEQRDKAFWCKYRDAAERLLGRTIPEPPKPRTRWRALRWFASEWFVTLALAVVLGFLLRR
jgi:hypothetical protein